MVLSISSGGRLFAMASREVVEKRGALIVLEGLDRSGKSSQSKALVSFLRAQGQAVEEWRFPDRTTAIGQVISSYLSRKEELDDRAIHLMFSANRWEKQDLMERTLRAGTTLVVDRYSYSGVAFTAAKGLNLKWCKGTDEGLLAADLVLYLNILPEEAAKRGEYGEERYEELEFQKRVAKFYRSLHDPSWYDVDASESFDEVHKVIRERSLSVIESCRSGIELLPLWPSA